MKCRKCGAELHPEQKVCIQCGEVTPAGGKFDVEEDRTWRPTLRQLQIVAVLVGIVILVLVLYKILYVVPPETVAKNWFETMLSRHYAVADDYVTSEFMQDLNSRMMDLRALAEMWLDDITSNNASYQFSAPTFNSPTNPHTARITVTIQSPDGQIVRQILMDLVRKGRRWKIDRVL